MWLKNTNSRRISILHQASNRGSTFPLFNHDTDEKEKKRHLVIVYLILDDTSRKIIKARNTKN